MYCADSNCFFEISSLPDLDNTFQSRVKCLKDFLKKAAFFPLALVIKALKTGSKVCGLGFGVFLVFVTAASSSFAREFFIERIAILAKDLADWLLLPFALMVWFCRLILAFAIHPNFYFNAI